MTFGLFSSHGNAKEVNALVDRLTESNKYLTTAIEKLTDEMASSGGARSTEYYRSAYDKQKQKIENDRQMLEAKMGYNSAHHSNNYYIRKAMGSGDWDTVSAYLGKSVRDTDSLWRLSPRNWRGSRNFPTSGRSSIRASTTRANGLTSTSLTRTRCWNSSSNGRKPSRTPLSTVSAAA